MFTAALFTIAKIWKQPKCPTIDTWIKKRWCIHIIKYYSAKIKIKLPYASTIPLLGVYPKKPETVI